MKPNGDVNDEYISISFSHRDVSGQENEFIYICILYICRTRFCKYI